MFANIVSRLESYSYNSDNSIGDFIRRGTNHGGSFRLQTET